jgi:hypothetical protein
MSELTYNGVALSYIRTREFRQEPMFSGDVQNQDYLYTHYHIAVECAFNVNLAPAILADPDPTTTMTRVRAALMVPRQALAFTINGVSLQTQPAGGIASAQATRLTDANNGPIPRGCNILKISENTFIVQFSIDTWVVDCTGGGGLSTNPPQFISNRFVTEFDINRTQYVTITTRGRVITAANVNVNPDVLRGVIAPQLPAGMVCNRMHFTVQENGLALEYTFEDQEVFREPPQPMYRAEGEYIASTPNGVNCIREARVKVTGYKYTAPGVVFGMSVMLAARKVTASRRGRLDPIANPGSQILLIGGAVRQSYDDNTCECTLRVMQSGIVERVNDTPMPLGPFGDNTWYTQSAITSWRNLGNLPPPPPLLYGSSALIANLAFLRDGCATLPARMRSGDLAEPTAQVTRPTQLNTTAIPNIVAGLGG